MLQSNACATVETHRSQNSPSINYKLLARCTQTLSCSMRFRKIEEMNETSILMYYGSRTVDICSSERRADVMAAVSKVWRQSIHIEKNNRAKFYPDIVWIHGALGCLEEVAPTRKTWINASEINWCTCPHIWPVVSELQYHNIWRCSPWIRLPILGLGRAQTLG